MNLKKLCEALGWHRIRRWKDFIKEVKAVESSYETQKHLKEKREAQASISPYFDFLFGDWRPNPDLVNRVWDTIETRPIAEVLDAVLKTPIAYSQYQGAQGWIAVDNTVRLTTLELAEEIIKDTPVDKLKWIAERRDCDDISEIFESICRLFYAVNVRTVLAFSGGHAFVGFPLIVDSDRTTSHVEWRFLEPQNDRWQEINVGQGGMYDVKEALIV